MVTVKYEATIKVIVESKGTLSDCRYDVSEVNNSVIECLTDGGCTSVEILESTMKELR